MRILVVVFFLSFQSDPSLISADWQKGSRASASSPGQLDVSSDPNKSHLQLFDSCGSAASTPRLWSLTPLHSTVAARRPAKWPDAYHWPEHCFYSRHRPRRARRLPSATPCNVARMGPHVSKSLAQCLSLNRSFAVITFLCYKPQQPKYYPPIN